MTTEPQQSEIPAIAPEDLLDDRRCVWCCREQGVRFVDLDSRDAPAPIWVCADCALVVLIQIARRGVRHAEQARDREKKRRMNSDVLRGRTRSMARLERDVLDANTELHQLEHQRLQQLRRR